VGRVFRPGVRLLGTIDASAKARRRIDSVLMPPDPASPISIVVADDHPIFRDGLRRLLEAEADLRVVGMAGDGEETVRLVREHKPEVLLLDLAMPRRSGMDVLRDLSADRTDVRIIVLAAMVDETQMIEALELGARGIVLKDTTTSLLLKCPRQAPGFVV